MGCLTTSQMLADARSQYHLLMTGSKAEVIVDQNGERVEFTATDADKLAQYIKSLERLVGAGGNVGPARVTL